MIPCLAPAPVQPGTFLYTPAPCPSQNPALSRAAFAGAALHRG